MSVLGRRGIHYFQKLNSANVPTSLIQKGQNRVIEASLTLIRERAKLKILKLDMNDDMWAFTF
ncbi:Arginase 1, mitochondrial, partial [Cucurbita argyrosperma subsp. argyrosperma]